MLATTADEVRLVEDPTFYFINARVEPDEGPRIYVSQDTRYTNATGVPLESLYFRLFPNKVSFGSEVTFQTVTVEGNEVELDYGANRTAVGLILPSPLAPAEATEVHMEYDVTVPVDNIRGYGTFNYQDGVFVLSNFYAMMAVYEQTGWNLSLAPDYGDPTYAETSFFAVEITVPQGMRVITSGSTIEQRDNNDGSTTSVCLSGPMRDFMVVIGDGFESSSCTVGYIRLRSHYLPGHREVGEEILGYARNCLRAYQQSFGPYPFAELDVVEAPLYAGGMEYPGLVIVAADYYESGGEFVEFITAHEVAHQWWYSMVGNDQVNVPWLDESLTNYSTVYYYEYAYDRARANLAFERYIEGRYQGAKDKGRDGVVYQPVEALAPEDYGPIVYGKGAVFFHELREELGEAVFHNVLWAYLEDRKYKLSTPDDLLRVIREVSGEDVYDLYEEWILSSE
jgi:aminopeptidase N